MLVCHVPDDAQIAPSATGVQTPLLHTLCSTQLSALNTASSGLNISVNVAQEAPHRVPKQLCRSATVLTLLTCCVTAAAIGHTNHTLSDVLCHIHTGAAVNDPFRIMAKFWFLQATVLRPTYVAPTTYVTMDYITLRRAVQHYVSHSHWVI